MRAILDTDAFFAALVAEHEHHARTRVWLDGIKADGWGIAVETWLGTLRLLINPVVMGGGPLPISRAMDVLEAELAGPHPGRLVQASPPPDRSLFSRVQGHRQVTDFWLVQTARDHRTRLATRDRGTLANWPEWTIDLSG